MTACLPPSSTSPSSWLADLHLGFAHRDGRAVLRENRHNGPLRVQKALYPEGESVCQVILLHPPSGIAGGDHLSINIAVDRNTHAQITTPGAGKWYRSSGPEASQKVMLNLDDGATLEWLPQESIIFDGARARMDTRVSLAGDSRFIGWDILCLGRTAAGERFTQGRFDLFYRVDRNNQPIWIERGGFSGADPMLGSPAGWAGATVCGTLLCSFPELPEHASALLEACRSIAPVDAAGHSLSVLPGLIVARYLGQHSEAARRWFIALWEILRPVYCPLEGFPLGRGRPAIPPRIWTT